VTDMTARVWPGGQPATGVVHLLTRTGQTWRMTGRLVAPQLDGSLGGDVSLSSDGTRVAVTGRGRAYVGDTRRNQVVQELAAPPGAPTLGGPVAISPDGKTVVIGAPEGGARRLGVVSVFVDDPAGGWTRRWRLEEQPGAERSYFGASVAVTDAQTVVVGAPLHKHRGVSVFDRRGAVLVRTARFTPRYDTQARFLGCDVAVSADGSTVIAGAFGRDTARNRFDHAGAGYRWVRSPDGWSWAGLLSVAHPTAGGDQGWSVAVSADGRAVVLGAPGRRSARRGWTGAAMVFSPAL
jgi:hypothetical protein